MYFYFEAYKGQLQIRKKYVCIVFSRRDWTQHSQPIHYTALNIPVSFGSGAALPYLLLFNIAPILGQAIQIDGAV